MAGLSNFRLALPKAMIHMGGCQNYGPSLGPYYNPAPSIQGTQKGTIILTTTHMGLGFWRLERSRGQRSASLVPAAWAAWQKARQEPSDGKSSCPRGSNVVPFLL